MRGSSAAFSIKKGVASIPHPHKCGCPLDANLMDELAKLLDGLFGEEDEDIIIFAGKKPVPLGSCCIYSYTGYGG